jgi:transcription-repair coupling factor (superfamily II helicase)
MTIPERLQDEFAASLRRLGVEGPGVQLDGLPVQFLPLVLNFFRAATKLPVITALQNLEDGIAVHDILAGIVGRESVAFLSGIGPSPGTPPGALSSLAADEPPTFLIITEDLLADGIPDQESVRRSSLTIQAEDISYPQLKEWLDENAYEPVSLVTEPGTYALRGGVIDCYPINSDSPIRCDFVGDDLEEVREFDIHTQISTGRIKKNLLLSRHSGHPTTVPVFDLYPSGWVMARPTESEGQDSWQFTSSEKQAASQSIDLSIEKYSARETSPEALLARWQFLAKSTDTASALFLCDREPQYERARHSLAMVPLQHAAGNYPVGCYSVPMGLLVLTPAELWNRSVHAWMPSGRKAPSIATVKRHLDTMEPGDPIIHVSYGVGRYRGLSYLSVGGTKQECLAIEYHGGGRVYVSVDKISLVLPYSAEDGKIPAWDSLQSKRWARVQRQTRRSAEEVVDQLAELYAQRALVSGISFPEDDELQLEMEEAFPFEYTPDQTRATEEIKHDMELPQPMDRLLCGDVGFGKTELALRAAFKAIRGGHQVALLAPTTILADQHFISFRARLEPFAVNVQMLSRFITPSSQRQTLQALSSGSVDLVVGTHRLLSPDIAYRKLGLLIIDEEHRFGVKQKERLKELRANVDVLSLSATPIPRTLHFSLAGIRDISKLDTPPLERIPIITSVKFFSWDLVQQSINRELGRGGQVFFVHSDVKNIALVARDLAGRLPGISLGIAHGQMTARELEGTMLDFSEGKIQVLVCTSIIESGIDLPNVNTVIINNAHRFGLAQLYQIRGRVGRSNRQAYAYLLIPHRPKLAPEALKRLKTIERHTILGSGYAIALKDLEIRGAGNLFGIEQSGHVAAVGLDLYTKIINDIIRERNLLPEEVPSFGLPREEVAILHLFARARIPDSYVPDPHLRLNLYRRLAVMTGEDELSAFREELLDRFGQIPEEAEELIKTTQLSILAALIGIRTIRGAAGQLRVDFSTPENPARLLEQIKHYMEQQRIDYRFQNLKTGDVLRLTFSPDERDLYDAVFSLLRFLHG